MKLITPIHITYIAAICLLFILGSQAYLVYDYFQTTRAGLIRESDTVLEEAFKKDLNLRNKKFNELNGTDTVTVATPQTDNNSFKAADLTKVKDLKGNLISVLELAVNNIVSKKVPLNLSVLDSITGKVLQLRNINSDYIIVIIDNQTDKILSYSKKEHKTSLLQVPSKYLIYDYEKGESLQLILVNPFSVVLQRMGMMLLSSLFLAIICLLAFRALYDMLARQKKLVAFKNEFLSTIAHELKRPVASLSFNLDCLSAPAFINNQSKRDMLLSKSINATTELNSTINMIVGLAKLEEGLLTLDLKPINLKELLDELKIRFISNAVKQIEIETTYQADKEFIITGDAQLLSQCFANLIDNAIKYSGNEVLIIISLSEEGRGIKVSVKDNGLGIPEAKLPVIFDKYTRVHADITKVNGFGIGLNYVKTIVEKHGGTVEVKSEPGKGSEFIVLLAK